MGALSRDQQAWVPLGYRWSPPPMDTHRLRRNHHYGTDLLNKNMIYDVGRRGPMERGGAIEVGRGLIKGELATGTFTR
ncbi:hypothetical protein EVAR_82883_1 [Eumeta japonica]|uniref:Uncharacterized protein n=1 Tax=Eumeta variegata TaxID=151549 RepID=A0A4C1V447_EUMVA|nr:hypothetical protein EVAR_82883_1 [Eumeta japonica]